MPLSLVLTQLYVISMQELVRKSQGILNKLTPQNFDKLVAQMKELSLNTVDRLRKVIDIIFEKVSELKSTLPLYHFYTPRCQNI